MLPRWMKPVGDGANLVLTFTGLIVLGFIPRPGAGGESRWVAPSIHLAPAADASPAAGTVAARSLSRKYPYPSDLRIPLRNDRGLRTVQLKAPQPDWHPLQVLT